MSPLAGPELSVKLRTKPLGLELLASRDSALKSLVQGHFYTKGPSSNSIRRADLSYMYSIRKEP